MSYWSGEQMTTDQAQSSESRRFLVLAPVGTLLKPIYDGDNEAAALEAYREARRLNKVPLFSEVRQAVG